MEVFTTAAAAVAVKVIKSQLQVEQLVVDKAELKNIILVALQELPTQAAVVVAAVETMTQILIFVVVMAVQVKLFSGT
jgi:hypothetical protein